MHRRSLRKEPGVFVFRYHDADLYRNETFRRNFDSSRSDGYDARLGSPTKVIQSAVQVKESYCLNRRQLKSLKLDWMT